MTSAVAQKLVETVEAFGAAITALPQTQRFSEVQGAQSLPMDKHDLAYSASVLGDLVQSVDWSNVNDEIQDALRGLALNIDTCAKTIVPHLFSGSGVSLGCAALLQHGLTVVEDLISDEQRKATLRLPANLNRHVQLANSRLETATAALDGIDEKVASINRASQAALDLPVTLHELELAVKDIGVAKASAAQAELSAKVSARDAERSMEKLEASSVRADDVLKKVTAAYRAATSQGLAQAFAVKSDKLNRSMALWVFVLVCSLAAAGFLAAERFPAILAAVGTKPDWGVVFVHVILGTLGLAPPVWLAWVSTKQIGQRFRLAEDYGYKAALSAAYEGYRSEAAQLDPIFQAQLFATAIGRLDELPLRLVESDVHGSPFHELIHSKEFREAAAAVPALKDRVLAMLKPKREAASTTAATPVDESNPA